MIDRRHPAISLTYHLVLGIASGIAVGFFTWIAADRMTDAAQPAWPYLIVGAVAMTALVRVLVTRTTGRRWVHLLWIPVVALVALMAMIVLALRALT